MGRTAAYRDLPPYPEPEARPAPMLVLGEAHSATTVARAPEPTWLTIPQRGLYTGILILGAVGTGKTSACMYPYVDQLLRWRADDADHKMGGLVLEVKGDFCRQVRGILTRAGRETDYVEVGLHSGVDRATDDFPTLPAPHVLVDGDASYPTYRLLNREIARQNKDVLAQSGGLPFAALAAEKWLDLHQEGQPDENRHVGGMRRGFRDAAGDRVWTGTESTDRSSCRS